MARDTTETSRRGYDRPEKGDDWAASWDELVEDLDGNALYDVSNEISNSNLQNSQVTVAGNSVGLGGSTSVALGDLTGVLADAVIKNTGDNLEWQTDASDDLVLKNTTDGTTLMTVDQDTGDVTWDALSGSPSFGGHDHSEGGTTTVPNAGLSNSQVTVAGNSVSLGGSTAVSADDLSDVATASEAAGQLLLWHATNGQYENAALTAGNALSATTGDASLTLDVDAGGIDTNELAADAVTSTEITDGTVSNTDLSNSQVTYNGVSASLGGTATLKLRDIRVTTSVSSATTTNGEDTVFVDPSGTGGVTITLASADATAGQEVVVQDIGGAASSNTITVDTEGSETFKDGDSAKTITTDRAWLKVRWDGSNWVSNRYQQFKSVDAASLSVTKSFAATGLDAPSGDGEKRFEYNLGLSNMSAAADTTVNGADITADGTAQSIIELDEMMDITVFGISDNGDTFVDKVYLAGFSSTQDVAHENGSPASRSYSTGGGAVRVSISDSSVTYSIATKAFGAQ